MPSNTNKVLSPTRKVPAFREPVKEPAKDPIYDVYPAYSEHTTVNTSYNNNNSSSSKNSRKNLNLKSKKGSTNLKRGGHSGTGSGAGDNLYENLDKVTTKSSRFENSPEKNGQCKRIELSKMSSKSSSEDADEEYSDKKVHQVEKLAKQKRPRKAKKVEFSDETLIDVDDSEVKPANVKSKTKSGNRFTNYDYGATNTINQKRVSSTRTHRPVTESSSYVQSLYSKFQSMFTTTTSTTATTTNLRNHNNNNKNKNNSNTIYAEGNHNNDDDESSDSYEVIDQTGKKQKPRAPLGEHGIFPDDDPVYNTDELVVKQNKQGQLLLSDGTGDHEKKREEQEPYCSADTKVAIGGAFVLSLMTTLIVITVFSAEGPRVDGYEMN